MSRAQPAKGRWGSKASHAPDLLPLMHARDAAEAKVAAIGTVNPRPPGIEEFNRAVVSRADRAAAGLACAGAGGVQPGYDGLRAARWRRWPTRAGAGGAGRASPDATADANVSGAADEMNGMYQQLREDMAGLYSRGTGAERYSRIIGRTGAWDLKTARRERDSHAADHFGAAGGVSTSRHAAGAEFSGTGAAAAYVVHGCFGGKYARCSEAAVARSGTDSRRV